MPAALTAFAYTLARWFIRPLIGWLMKYRVSPDARDFGLIGALKLDPTRPVCYVLPQRSWIDQFALERLCRDQGLPRPYRTETALPTVERAGLLYLPAMLATFTKAGATGGPLSKLLEMAIADESYDFQFVPVSIFWGRDPGSETSLFKLIFADSVQAGRVHKLMIAIFNGRNVLAHFGLPLGFRQYLVDAANSGRTDGARLARALPRALHFHFLRARTAALGPTLVRRGTMIEGMLNSPALIEAIATEASRKGLSVEQARTRARKCAEEIAADYSTITLRFLEVILERIWNRVYKGVEVAGLERVRELAHTHEIVYLPSHRSHADYLLLSFVLNQAGLVPPHIAAGINLNFWPVGGLLRRGGAFYMRRKFSGDALYTAVFRAYVDALMRRGYSIEFFPEGGRSRTGRLLAPKTGLLAMACESGLRLKGRKVALVPVFIGYDKIFEIGSYAKELRGAGKQKESAEGLLKATRILGKSYGRAYVNCGEPIILQDHADANLPGWREAMAADPDGRPEGFSDWVRSLAREHMRRINTAAVAGPVGLAACALLASPRRAAAEDELVEQIGSFIDLLDAWPQRERLMVPVKDPRAALEWSAPIAGMVRVPHAWGDLLVATPRGGVQMTYNRNNIQHLFAMPALIASFFRTRGVLTDEAIVTGCRALYPFLRNEFFLPWPTASAEDVARGYLDRMLAGGLLEREGEGRIKRPDVGRQAYSSFAALGRVLGETLERQAMAVLLLTEERASGAPLRRETFENDCRLLAERMAVLTGRDAPEFFDKALFTAYLDTLIEIGLARQSPEGGLEVDARCEKIAERSVELLSDESRQMLLQLLARRRNPSPAAA